MTPGVRSALTRAGLVGGGVLLALALVEGGLRLAGWGYARARLAGPPPRPGRTVLCLGDSFTFGVGAVAGGAYPDALRRLLEASGLPGVAVVNGGVPGANSSMILRDLEGALERHRPAVAVVSVGANNNWNLEANNYTRFLRLREALPARLEGWLWGLRTYKLLRRSAPPPNRRWRRPKAPGEEAALAAARRLDAAGDPRAAVSGLESFLRARPEAVRARRLLGWLKLHRLEDNAGAAAAFEAVRRGDPGDPAIPLELALAYQRVGEPGRARDAYRDGLLLDPGNEALARALRYGLPAYDDLDLHRRVIERDLEAMDASCRRHGTRLVIQTYPFRNWPNEALSRAARKLGVPLVDQEDLFQGEARRERFFAQDGHLNADGYRRMAERLHRALRPLLTSGQ